MTPSLYLSVAGRSPQRHAALPTHQIVHSTTPYYEVLLHTTKLLVCARKHYKALRCTTKIYKVYSVLKYYKVLLQYYSVLIGVTHETSFTMRGATGPTCLRGKRGGIYFGIFFLFFFGFFFFFWSPGPLIPWCPGHLVPLHLVPSLSGPQCPGPLVPWSSGLPWSPGPLVPCSSGLLVSWSSVLFRSFFSNLSFTLFYYQFYIFTLSCVC